MNSLSRWLIVAGWLCASYGALADLSPAGEPDRPGSGPAVLLARRFPRAGVDTALGRRVKIDVEDQPLRAFVADSVQQLGVKLELDSEALQEAHVKPDVPITCAVEGITLGAALDWILEPLGLAVVVDGQALRVTSRERAARMMVTATYPISGVTVPATSDPQSDPVPALCDLIKRVVEPASWEETSGKGTIQKSSEPKVIEIFQTPRAHATIARLFHALHTARSGRQLVSSIELLDQSELQARFILRRILAEKATLDFKNQPLEEVADYLRKRYLVNVEIDRPALAVAGLAADLPINAKIEGEPLGPSLWSVLVAHKLAYLFRDEMLVITTPAVAARTMEIRVYPVRDLIKAGKNPDFGPLVQAITQAVNPNGWNPAAGLGMIEPYGPCLALVVVQTDGAHGQIAELLAQRRQPPAPRRPAGLHP